MKNRPIKLGIVGMGQRALSLIPPIAALSDVELVACCDQDETRLRSFIRRLGGDDLAHTRRLNPGAQLFTTDLSKMLEGDLVDAVIIAVPDRFHKEVALQCFAAGKHVLLEKPMALSADDCRAIIAAKTASGRELQIGFVLRCTAFYQAIKSFVSSGRLGQVMSVSAAEYLGVSHSASYMRRWHRKKENSGGFLLAKCSHDLDLLSWLVGSRPKRVSSFGGNNFFVPSKQPATHCSRCGEVCPYRFDGAFVFMTEQDQLTPSANNFDLCVYNPDKDIVDNQVCVLEYENQVRAMFSLQLFHPVGTRQITISGSGGYLQGDLADGSLRFWAVGSPKCEEIIVTAQNDSGHGGGDLAFLQDFVLAIRGEMAPIANLEDGLVSTVVGLALDRAREQGAVVTISPDDYRL